VSSIALLDVNVLIALFQPSHIYHEAAHDWFATNRNQGWATCPLTENGVLRILANSAVFGDHHHSPASLRSRLDTLCSSEEHVFWPDSVSLRDEQLYNLSGVSHRQITDIYLLGLAVANTGRLATFDRRIPLEAVINARRDSLEIISG
jgi:toxin-antitoxin system PIN domain toxin